MSTHRFAVTGATGQLGRHVVETLLDRGVEPGQVVATGRAVERLEDLAARGVVVRRADMDEPATLAEAFDGVERLLLVSGSEPGDRVRQHTAAVEAAAAAGVARLVYTSIAGAGSTPMLLAQEHTGTEAVLADAGLTVTVLRNAFYVENYTAQLPTYAEHGLATAAGDGRVSLALRREYAEAAATVLLEDGHEGAVYTLGGPAATMADVAAALSEVSGQDVTLARMSVDELEQVLLGAGMPAAAATTFADVDRGIADGELLVTTDDLTRLLGREPLPLREAVAEALKA
ncbi:NmrA family NAD(P)-binding protein [Pseudokineococcus sp. 1T1Z-3]|uniref:NmrA family NAD(P)-binding protein n=1 Tax=Pseudokineococcus sp. 1T1Z-3 TaxID=3132745 RepID=UPI0030B46390